MNGKSIVAICLSMLLAGCPYGDIIPLVIEHDATVTLKDGVPCFAVADDGDVLRKDISLASVMVSIRGAYDPADRMWEKVWYDALLPAPAECIPYEGEKALQSNTVYGVRIPVYVKGQGRDVSHDFNAFFCLTKSRNGETLLQTFGAKEPPTDCPIVDQ